MVLASGSSLDAAGDIDAPGSDLADGVGHVARCQSAGQQHAVLACQPGGQLPVAGFTAAASQSRVPGIQQNVRAGGRAVRRETDGRIFGFNHGTRTQRLKRSAGQRRQGCRVFLAVQLGQIQRAVRQCFQDLLRPGVDENADAKRHCGSTLDGAHDVSHNSWIDVAGRLLVENESQQISARLHRHLRVLQVGQPADLDLDTVVRRAVHTLQ